MKKVVLYIACSLDGYIADSYGKIDWLGGQDEIAPEQQTDGGYGDFIAGVDTVVMGYSTYHQVVTELSPGVWPYAGMQSYVLTHHQAVPAKDVTFTDQPVTDLTKSLQKTSGKSIWIMGGASIITPLIEADLIDEYHLSIMPMLLGSGIRLFQEQDHRIPLRLISSTTNNGVIDCIYHRR